MTEPAATTEITTTEAPAPRSFADAADEVFGPGEPTIVVDVPVEAEKVEEKAAPATKEERAATRIVAAKRAEQKAAADRQTIRAEQEKLTKRAAELDALEKKIRLVQDDPVKFFEEYKGDPKAFLEKLAGEHKPENIAVKKATEVEAELARLKTELAQRDAATREAAQRSQANASWKEASAAFTSFVGDQAEKFPNLVQEYTEDQATEMAFAVLTEVVGKDPNGQPVTRTEAYRRQFGAYPDHEAVAEYLDSLAQQRIEARSKSAWRKRGDGANPASQAHGNSNAVPPVKGTSPRTLTSRDASQRAAAPKAWSQEAADEESIRILEQAYRKQG